VAVAVDVAAACWQGVGHAWVLQLTVSVADPAQGAPPFEAAGESHFRVRVLVPPPQDLEQPQNAVHAPQLPFTAHDCVLHATVSVAGPEHGFPHTLGAGLLHFRDLILTPPPQLRVHPQNALNAPYFPSMMGLTIQARVSVADPSQPFPQASPAMQGRVRVCVPAPHDFEHALHSPYAPHLEWTIAFPQDLVSLVGPVHGLPHSLPAIHTRVRVCVPIPQLAEQALHAP